MKLKRWLYGLIIASYSKNYLFYIEIFVLYALLIEKLKITELLYLTLTSERDFHIPAPLTSFSVVRSLTGRDLYYQVHLPELPTLKR